jgi:hypothetical protein
MLRSTARRRLTAIAVLAAFIVAGLVTISAAGAASSRSQVVYRNFCPVSPAQVAAAGPYTVDR